MKKNILFLCAALALILVLAAGCGNSNSSSSSSSSSSSVSSMPPSSSPSTSPSSSTPDSSDSTSDPLTSDSTTATMSADFSMIGTLDASSQDWGHGLNRDDKNRSLNALSYNEKYGGYNALFIAADKPTVYLTFDEGYEYGLTPQFLDILKEKGIKALFFVTRDFAKAEPALVQRMIDEGHTVGNHSWTHKNYSTLSPQEACDDMMKLDAYMQENFHYKMKLFRFPSGNFNVQTLAVAQQMGYKSVFWSFAYKDWLTDAQPDPAPALEKISGAAANGTIYLLHAVSKTNLDVLPDVIDNVRAQGFEWGDPAAL